MTKKVNKISPKCSDEGSSASKRRKTNNQNVQNDSKNQSDSTLQSVHNMCQELLEKQKNLEKTNEEIVEKLRSAEDEIKKLSEEPGHPLGSSPLPSGHQNVLNELQLIRDELKELKPKPVPAATPESSDNEDETDSESENESDIMPTTRKCFVLKHVFKNVSKMKENEREYSETEEHFGVKWRMYVYGEKEHLAFFLHCWKSMDTEKWSIETERKQILISNQGENCEKKIIRAFDNSE